VNADLKVIGAGIGLMMSMVILAGRRVEMGVEIVEGEIDIVTARVGDDGSGREMCGVAALRTAVFRRPESKSRICEIKDIVHKQNPGQMKRFRRLY
jgi:hypothetical protein